VDWIIYGATGVAGGLIAEAAARRGHRPLLAGRDADRLAPLAARLGTRWRAVDVDDGPGLTRLAGEAPLMLLAASPFEATSAPMLRACLAAGAHYLDVANEPAVFDAAYGLHDAAERAGVTVLPGVGFGAAAADTLARHVADRLPGAEALDLTLFTYTSARSPGAQANALRVAARGGLLRRGGRLVPVRLGAGARRADGPSGRCTVVPVPTGELSAAFRTTGIPDITVAMPVGGPPVMAGLVTSALGLAARSRALQRRAERLPRTPLPAADPARRSHVCARASAGDRAVTAWLETGEGYAFTAESAVRAAEAVLARGAAGAYSPGALLGADFALDIPGTRRLAGAPGDRAVA
jgi:short subunit dehydrogenase-like uncharacterized protein